MNIIFDFFSYKETLNGLLENARNQSGVNIRLSSFAGKGLKN